MSTIKNRTQKTQIIKICADKMKGMEEQVQPLKILLDHKNPRYPRAIK